MYYNKLMLDMAGGQTPAVRSMKMEVGNGFRLLAFSGAAEFTYIGTERIYTGRCGNAERILLPSEGNWYRRHGS